MWILNTSGHRLWKAYLQHAEHNLTFMEPGLLHFGLWEAASAADLIRRFGLKGLERTLAAKSQFSTLLYWLINPHQRCGYSDSPFARIHYFYPAGSGNGLEGLETVCPQTRNRQNGSI